MEGSRNEEFMLSAWHRDQQKWYIGALVRFSCSELVGCVTYGMKHLLGRKRPVFKLDDTSYKLKPESVGRQVTTESVGRQVTTESVGRQVTTEHEETGAEDKAAGMAHVRRLSGLQPLKVVVECLHMGYGFTVRGGCPTRVGHVRQGSSAQLAGLRDSDYITHINGCDVTSLSKQEVAKVVRHANTDITLDIRRCHVESPWQQEIVDSWESLQLEKTSSQRDVLVQSTGEEERGARKTREDGRGSSCLSSDVTFSLLSVPVEEQERLRAVESIHLLEQEFVIQMQCGIQRFSRPLRHCLISSKQHATLFQNVEKLVTISEYHLGHLRHISGESDSSGIGSGDDDVISTDIGAIYRAKLKMCSEAYRLYSAGLTKSIQLLGSLMLQPLVISFLQEASVDGSDSLTIEDFLCKPIQHLDQLYRTFERILLYTASDHADQDNLQAIVRALGSVCAHNSSVCQKPSHSMTSTEGSRSPRSTRRQHRERSSDKTCKNTPKTAKMIISDRPVLFSGELMSVCAATCLPLLVLLMDDTLLMTRIDSEGHMTLVGEPLALKDIVRAQFECDHLTDFILSAQKDGTTATRNYRLRAGCYDDKVAWRNVLERQIKTCVSPKKIWSVSV